MTLKIYTRSISKLTNRQLVNAWFQAYRMKLILSSKRKWFPNRESYLAYLLTVRSIKSLLSRKLTINDENYLERLKHYMLKLYKESRCRKLKFNQRLME